MRERKRRKKLVQFLIVLYPCSHSFSSHLALFCLAQRIAAFSAAVCQPVCLLACLSVISCLSISLAAPGCFRPFVKICLLFFASQFSFITSWLVIATPLLDLSRHPGPGVLSVHPRLSTLHANWNLWPNNTLDFSPSLPLSFSLPLTLLYAFCPLFLHREIRIKTSRVHFDPNDVLKDWNLIISL